MIQSELNNISTHPKKNFALIGASGYIAPKHMHAIKESGNNLVAALDPFDSVGILDSFFPKTKFFKETERFDRYLDKKRRNENDKIEFVSICSPNHLHDAHIRMALRNDAHAICEKPMVLNPWNIDALEQVEKESGKRIFNILQLRLHKSIQNLKQKIDSGPKDKIYDVDLTYITSRGSWYYISWKGDLEKSGGIATNIGIHFFDMLGYIFGECQGNIVHSKNHKQCAGLLQLKRARVRWFLSVDEKTLPEEIIKKNQRTFRSIKVDGEEIDFSDGFEDLHTMVYNDILNNGGYSIEDVRPGIELTHHIRNAKSIGIKGDYHPFLQYLR